MFQVSSETNVWWWQELSIYPLYVTKEAYKLYAVSNQAKSYGITQTSNETRYLQEVSSRWQELSIYQET